MKPASAILNASGSGSASYSSLLMFPAFTGLSISGDLDGAPLIDLNGADLVTINGSLLGTGTATDLTISNLSASAAAGTSTIRLQADASDNLITYCNVLGSSSAAANIAGGNIYIAASSTVSGNDNNTVSLSNIGPAGTNLPSKGVYFSGTLAFPNNGNHITGNNIYDYFSASVTSAGIYVDNGTNDGEINNNRFYQSGTRTQTTGTQHSAIWIANTSGNNYQITGNTIGFASSSGTGIYTLAGTGAQPNNTKFFPIYLNVGTATPTSVQGNSIAGIAMSGNMSGTSDNSVFTGIYIFGGAVNIGNSTGNLIGSMTNTGSINITTSAAIALQSQVNGIFNLGNGNWNTSNNSIGGITASNSSTGYMLIYGLRGNIGTSNWTCTNNTIGGTVANSINNTCTAAESLVFGIFNSSYTGNFSGNIVRNMTIAGGTGATIPMIGINIDAPVGNQQLSQNIISNLSYTNAGIAATVSGISFTGSGAANLVERNFIHSLSSASNITTTVIRGIYAGAGTTTYQNNIISLSAATSGASVFGFQDAGGTNNLYHNTISLTGNTTAATQDAAYYSTAGNTRNVRNNIFANVRTGGTAAHHSYNIASATGLTLNYNDYIGLQTGTTGGANSVSTSPAFANAAGTNAADYVPASPVNGTTTTGVTADYNNTARNCAFTMGAFEVEFLSVFRYLHWAQHPPAARENCR